MRRRAVYKRNCVLAWCLLLPLLPRGALSQEAKGKSGPAPTAAPAPAPHVAMPEAEKIVLLLRTTLLTLNDALRTANFTVLCDVSAPGFREANSGARLPTCCA